MTNHYLNARSPEFDRDEKTRDACGLLWSELEILAALATVQAGFPQLPPWVLDANVAELVGRRSVGHSLLTLEQLGLAERVGKGKKNVLWRASARGAQRVREWSSAKAD